MAANDLVPVGQRPRLGNYLKATIESQAFLRELVSARVQSEYSKAFLGPAWLLVTPLLNSMLYFLVFGLLLGAQSNVPNYPLFLVTGVLLYTFVSRACTAATTSLARQRDFVRTIPFPRMLLVTASAGVEVRYLAWSVGVLLVMAGISAGIHVSWLLAMAAIALLVVFTTGIGLMLARLNAAIPDTAGLLPFALRAGGYLSGAYFPISGVASSIPVVGTLLAWNPVALALTATREALQGDVPNVTTWAVLAASAVAAFTIGVVVFWRGEPGYGRD